MARQLDSVDLAKDLGEAGANLCLVILRFQLAHQQEVLVKSARTHTSEGNGTVAGQCHVHVKHVIGVDVNDLIHLILHFVKHCEREGVLDRVFVVATGASEWVTTTACIAC